MSRPYVSRGRTRGSAPTSSSRRSLFAVLRQEFYGTWDLFLEKLPLGGIWVGLGWAAESLPQKRLSSSVFAEVQRSIRGT